MCRMKLEALGASAKQPPLPKRRGRKGEEDYLGPLSDILSSIPITQQGYRAFSLCLGELSVSYRANMTQTSAQSPDAPNGFREVMRQPLQPLLHWTSGTLESESLLCCLLVVLT